MMPKTIETIVNMFSQRGLISDTANRNMVLVVQALSFGVIAVAMGKSQNEPKNGKLTGIIHDTLNHMWSFD